MTAPADRTSAPPRSVLVAAYFVPLLVVGQFAMVAIIPVAFVLVASLRDARLRALRWWGVSLAAAYAVPLALWAIGPDRAPSLSKDMHPVWLVVIVVVAAAFIAASHLARRPVRGAESA